MFSTEQRRIAIETFIRFDHSYADTIAELGYPTRHSLRAWYKDYLEHGEVRPPKRQREPKLALEMRQAAVDCCLAHGKSEPCQYNGQWDPRFYAASIASGSYARALSKRSKNSCMASAGTRSPMDSCGR